MESNGNNPAGDDRECFVSLSAVWLMRVEVPRLDSVPQIWDRNFGACAMKERHMMFHSSGGTCIEKHVWVRRWLDSGWCCSRKREMWNWRRKRESRPYSCITSEK